MSPTERTNSPSFARAEHGFSAAEKALIACISLALILFVTRILLHGSEQGSLRAKATLEGQSIASGVSFDQPSSGSDPAARSEGGGGGGGGGGLFSDIVHGVLGVVSFIPGLNVPASILDAGLYALEGDGVNAAISLAGVIPVAGKGAKLLKVGSKTVKTGDKINDARKIKAGLETVEAETKLARRRPLALPPGKPGKVIVNKLEKHEAEFAEQIVKHRGGTLEGASTRGLPGIDGTLNKAPISLKETQGGLGAVLKHASKAESQAKNAKYSGVEVFIKAENVGSKELLDFAQKGPLSQIPKQGTVNAINVLTKDGWVRFIK